MPSYLEYGFIFAAPVACFLAWWLLIAAYKQEPPSWRNRISFLSLVLLTITILLFVPIRMYNSGAGWKTALGFDTHMRHTLLAAAIAIRTCAVAFIVSVFGKPKLIALIVIACIGTWMLWAISIIV